MIKDPILLWLKFKYLSIKLTLPDYSWSFDIRYAWFSSISQLNRIKFLKFTENFELIGCTKWSRPFAVMGLHDRSRVLRWKNYGFYANNRHSPAVIKVDLKHSSIIGYLKSRADFKIWSILEISKGKHWIFSLPMNMSSWESFVTSVASIKRSK